MLEEVENPTAANPANVRVKEFDTRHGETRRADSELFSLADIFRFLRRNLGTIGGAITIALAMMVVHLLLTTPVYRADAQVLIDANLPHVFRESYGEGRGILDTAQVESQIAILRSEELALAVIREMDLVPSFNKARETSQRGVADNEADPQEIRRAIAIFHDGLRVRRVGLSYVIEVSYRSNDPAKSARIANATVEAYIQDQLASRAEAARQGSQWLEGRIEQLRNQMNIAALKVQEFKVKRDYRILSKAETAPPPDLQVAAAKAAQNSLEELESTAQTYRKIYESYLQAHTESVQRQSFPVTNARVITKAAAYKSYPKVLLLLLLAVAGGAFLGLVAALLQEMYLRGRWRMS